MHKIRLFLLLSAVTSFSLSAQIISSGLVGDWKFNGNGADVSGYQNHGKVVGASLTKDRFGMCNSAYSFNGTTDYIEVKDSSTLDLTDSASISAWISPATSSFNSVESFRIVDKVSMGDYNGYLLDLIGSGSTPHLRFLGGSNIWMTKVGPTTIPFNKWTHVAATYDRGTIKLYIDGQLEKSIQEQITSLTTNNLPLRIGAGNSPLNSYFKGLIDDVKLFNRPLSATEIQLLFNEPQQCPKLVVYDTVYVYKQILVTDTLLIRVNITGTESQDLNSTLLKVYPNPSKNSVYVNTGNYNLLNEHSLHLVDLTGKVVFSSAIQAPLIVIPTSHLGTGTFLLQIKDGSGHLVESKKLVFE